MKYSIQYSLQIFFLLIWNLGHFLTKFVLLAEALLPTMLD